jgi:predicted nucleic acid-binding Zn ribbon protein
MSVSIGDALEKMLKRMKIGNTVHQWQAVSMWDTIVGEPIAKHAKAIKASYGKLYIAVDSPAWRNELLFQKQELLDRVNSHLTNSKIKEIILR